MPTPVLVTGAHSDIGPVMEVEADGRVVLVQPSSGLRSLPIKIPFVG